MPAEANAPWGKNVLVEFDEGIAWVSLNRPDKRNAMSPALNQEMFDTIDALEIDDRCGVVVITGSGNAFSAGMDLKEFFRANDGKSPVEFARIRRVNAAWQWRRLMYYPKATIAMVNGWCFGGAFTPLVSCDLSIAAEEATFGLSEINWGIIPGGVVTRAVAAKMNQADALYYIMTGETFDGKKAAQMGLVNEAVPLATCGSHAGACAGAAAEEPQCCAPPRSPIGTSRTWIGKRRKTISAPRTPNRQRPIPSADARKACRSFSTRNPIAPVWPLIAGRMMPVAREAATCGLTSPPCGMETGC